MLAFMVVSAVSFSIYMRESRVPSSHLRRESTARYLLKSALANAVARLNGNFKTNYEIWGETDPSGKHYNYLDTDGYVEGLYDDQYPGLNDFTILGHNGDYWTKRVFTPFGQVAPTTTVSTLTLEGLAYLPPAIINEARVFSRTTRTAQWQNLAYDLGRYAFCAIDVSDCFDINKLASAKRRTSHPGERISFTSLYHDNPEKGSQLASLISGKISTTPFVSLADFNVAMGNTLFTPFARYINNGGNNGNIYLEDDVIVSNALFITDTWFPATNAYLTAELELKTPSANTSRNFDLSKKEDQPFAEGDFENPSTFEYIRPNSAGAFSRMLEQNLGGVGLACLYDYLDKDQVPISLALPTVEAVPMVCAVDISGNPKVVFEVSNPQEDNWSFEDPKSDPSTRTISRSVSTVSFKGLDLNRVYIHGTVMFPFKRFKSEQRDSGVNYSVEALVAVYFGSSNMKCRLDDDCRERFQPTEEDWKEGGYRNGIFFYKGTDRLNQINDLIKKDITTEAEAFAEFSCQLDKPTNQRSSTVCHIVNEEEKTKPGRASNSIPVTQLNLDENVYTIDGIENGVGTFMLYDEVGAEAVAFAELHEKKKKKIYSGAERAKEALNWIQGVEATATKQTDCTNTFNDEGDGAKEKYIPYIAVWVRVVNQDGETVDLVPATLYDDEVHFGVKYKGHHVFDPFCGAGVPLLDFKDNRPDMAFVFDRQKLTAMPLFEPQVWKSLYAVDPRYNFAPEDWFGDASLRDAKPDNWRALVKNTINGEGGRSRDIFMFTSDQEHLQSIGELQFLPYVQPLGWSGVSLSSCDFKDIDRYDGANFENRMSVTAKFANNPQPNSTDYRCRFWKTYSSYSSESLAGGNPYYDLRNGGQVSVVNGTGGFRVNPLSPDMRVLSAALFDTPWDYYVASTNTRTNKIISEAESQPEDYAFGFYSTLPGDKWNEGAVTQIARAICEGTRSDAIDWMQKPGRRMYPFDWSGYYEDLWAYHADEDVEYLFGQKLGNNCKLHDVDRKFLFSFWRDCFQNRQQLFLIFLRAEPLAAGAGGVSNAQLGARGVALVWRDPAPPKSNQTRKARGEITDRQDWLDQLKNCPPHRTRVLFYHQFE